MHFQSIVEASGKYYLVSTIEIPPQELSPLERGVPFETAVFVADESGAITGAIVYQHRYATVNEAEAGHNQVVEDLKNGQLELSSEEDEE